MNPMDELIAITGNAAIARGVYNWHHKVHERLDALIELHHKVQPIDEMPEYGYCNECYTEGGTNVEWPCETAWILGAHVDGVPDWGSKP